MEGTWLGDIRDSLYRMGLGRSGLGSQKNLLKLAAGERFKRHRQRVVPQSPTSSSLSSLTSWESKLWPLEARGASHRCPACRPSGEGTQERAPQVRMEEAARWGGASQRLQSLVRRSLPAAHLQPTRADRRVSGHKLSLAGGSRISAESWLSTSIQRLGAVQTIFHVRDIQSSSRGRNMVVKEAANGPPFI